MYALCAHAVRTACTYYTHTPVHSLDTLRTHWTYFVRTRHNYSTHSVHTLHTLYIHYTLYAYRTHTVHALCPLCTLCTHSIHPLCTPWNLPATVKANDTAAVVADTQNLLTLAYASTIGIYSGTHRFDPYVVDHFLHSACYDRGGKTVITFELTVHSSKTHAISQSMAAMGPLDLSRNITFINASSSPAYCISPLPADAISVSAPAAAHTATSHVAPMIWMSEGSLTIGSNESFSALLGFGLRLRAGQDAMKALFLQPHLDVDLARVHQ